jgi:hypothetical protein
MGLILCIVVTAASVQDRDGARPLLWRLAASFRTVTLVWADGGYAGKLVTWAAGTLHRTLQIVKRPDNLHTFKVLASDWMGDPGADATGCCGRSRRAGRAERRDGAPRRPIASGSLTQVPSLNRLQPDAAQVGG